MRSPTLPAHGRSSAIRCVRKSRALRRRRAARPALSRAGVIARCDNDNHRDDAAAKVIASTRVLTDAAVSPVRRAAPCAGRAGRARWVAGADQLECVGADADCGVGSVADADDGTVTAVCGVRPAQRADRRGRCAHRGLGARGAERDAPHDGSGRGASDRQCVRGDD